MQLLRVYVTQNAHKIKVLKHRDIQFLVDLPFQGANLASFQESNHFTHLSGIKVSYMNERVNSRA
jgi:hypothetical protein